MVGRAEFGHDRGQTREGAERGQERNQKATVILKHRIAADMAEIAAPDHEVNQRKIKRDEGIPADQKPRHQTQ